MGRGKVSILGILSNESTSCVMTSYDVIVIFPQTGALEMIPWQFRRVFQSIHSSIAGTFPPHTIYHYNRNQILYKPIQISQYFICRNRNAQNQTLNVRIFRRASCKPLRDRMIETVRGNRKEMIRGSCSNM